MATHEAVAEDRRDSRRQLGLHLGFSQAKVDSKRKVTTTTTGAEARSGSPLARTGRRREISLFQPTAYLALAAAARERRKRGRPTDPVGADEFRLPDVENSRLSCLLPAKKFQGRRTEKSL